MKKKNRKKSRVRGKKRSSAEATQIEKFKKLR